MRGPLSNRIPACAGTLALVLSASGCAMFSGGDSATSEGQSGPRSGLAAEAAKLMEVDRAFAAKAAELGAPEAFHEFLDPEGFRLPPSGEVPKGPQQVWAQLAALPKAVMSWEPRYAEVFAPGDWGWTWGDWQAHEPGAGGRRVAQGRYVTIWRKQADGSWKVRGALPSAEAR